MGVPLLSLRLVGRLTNKTPFAAGRAFPRLRIRFGLHLVLAKQLPLPLRR